jgi:Zn-dependent protease
MKNQKVPNKVKCQQCGAETYMPFRCSYCGAYFCGEHRLPENHSCPEYWRTKTPREQPTAKNDVWYRGGFTVKPPQRRGRIWFSTTELKHLLVGALLTLAIGFSMPLYWDLNLSFEILAALAVVFAFSFIVHELAHKITAQHYGLWAEFRITMFGALITLLSIISPFKIISPGAVMVGGMADKETIGKTSIAGPLTNIALALLFFAFKQVFEQILPNNIWFAFAFGVLINSFIALFNLIPFGILDGFKVFSWNKIIWAIAFAVSLVLTIYSYMMFPML